MIIQIITSRKVNGRWFLAPQQYLFVSQFVAPVSSTNPQGIIYYTIQVGLLTYDLPYDMCALLPQETPSTDMRGAIERWEAYATKDIITNAPETGGKTDVVRQALTFLGIDISKHHYQVDQIALRELENVKEDTEALRGSPDA